MTTAIKTTLLLLATAICCSTAMPRVIAANELQLPAPDSSGTVAGIDDSGATTAETTADVLGTAHAHESKLTAEAFDHNSTFKPDAISNQSSAFNPCAATVSLPEYAYCEIIAGHLPGYQGTGVIFDFGQKTEAWAYNWLEDAEGGKLIFASKIEALNYMVCRGWEFVEAYTSGEENRNVHYLLRISTSRLSAAEKQILQTPPQAQETKKSRKKK